MKSFIGICLLMLVSMSTFAQSIGSAFVPPSGRVTIEGREVTVSFELSSTNADYLKQYGWSNAEGYEEWFVSGLGITLDLPFDIVERNVRLEAKGIEAILDDVVADKTKKNDVRIQILSSDPGPQAVDLFTGDSTVFFGTAHSTRKVTAIIKNVHLLPAGFDYSLKFILPEVIPTDTQVGVSFNHVQDRVQYEVGGIESTLDNIKYLYDMYGFVGDFIDLVNLVVYGPYKHARGITVAGVFLGTAVDATITDLRRVNDLRYQFKSSYLIAELYNYSEKTFYCWDGAVNSDLEFGCTHLTGTGGDISVNDYPVNVGSSYVPGNVNTTQSGTDFSGLYDPGTPPTQDSSGQGDTDLSISQFHIAQEGGSFERELYITLNACESTLIKGELELTNKSDYPADDIDIDYRFEDQDKNFDTDDPKVDEDEISIAGGTTITKTMGRSRVTARCDATGLDIYNKDGVFIETIQAINRQATGYYFVDVENKATGDDDISSTHSGDEEYGVLHVSITGNPVEFDLSFSPMQSDRTRQGDLYTLKTYLTNDTPYATPDDVVIDFYSDGVFFRDITIPALRAGEHREVSVSGRSYAVGQERKKACLSITRNDFDLKSLGDCSLEGILTVDYKPAQPTGFIWGGSCTKVSGRVNDQIHRDLDIHIYDPGGKIGTTRANSSGYFTYTFPQSQMDAKREWIRVYAIDDNAGGYAGNRQIGGFTRERCYPTGTVDIKRATNLRSQSYYHTTNHDSLIGKSEWRREGVTFKAYPTSKWVSGTRLIYFNWNGTRRSHVPSTSPTEGVGGGYTRGHATMRCPTRQLPGTRPLWRMHNTTTKAHRAAQDAEVIKKSERSGFRKEHVLCYVWPVPQG